jgi:predicted AAA+ superfamily ATPase
VWIQREIEPNLAVLAASRPALLLCGPRQSGKSSLLLRCFPDVAYVSLDLPRDAEQAELAGDEFLRRHGDPLVIDELQYAPRLLRYLKAAIDAERERNGRYLLAGSQKFALMQDVSESLAGRVSVVDLHTLSLTELVAAGRSLDSPEAILDALWKGGYPEVHARDLDPVRFYADYVATYLERDVRQAVNVRSLRDFDRFLRLCATRTGQLLNMNALAGDLGISGNTIRSWLSVLEASNVIALLPPFYRNLGKRLVKAPKLYFLDTGLACHLAGFASKRELGASGLLGAFFETLVLGQIVRARANRGLPASVWFWRDHYGNEVDFVIPVGERVHLIACKWMRANATPRGLENVAATFGESGILSRTIVHADPAAIVATDGVVRRGPVDFSWLVDPVPA